MPANGRGLTLRPKTSRPSRQRTSHIANHGRTLRHRVSLEVDHGRNARPQPFQLTFEILLTSSPHQSIIPLLRCPTPCIFTSRLPPYIIRAMRMGELAPDALHVYYCDFAYEPRGPFRMASVNIADASAKTFAEYVSLCSRSSLRELPLLTPS